MPQLRWAADEARRPDGAVGVVELVREGLPRALVARRRELVHAHHLVPLPLVLAAEGLRALELGEADEGRPPLVLLRDEVEVAAGGGLGDAREEAARLEADAPVAAQVEERVRRHADEEQRARERRRQPLVRQGSLRLLGGRVRRVGESGAGGAAAARVNRRVVVLDRPVILAEATAGRRLHGLGHLWRRGHRHARDDVIKRDGGGRVGQVGGVAIELRLLRKRLLVRLAGRRDRVRDGERMQQDERGCNRRAEQRLALVDSDLRVVGKSYGERGCGRAIARVARRAG